jgi:peptidoglycan/LPS O-acetylase OafA/YrhL
MLKAQRRFNVQLRELSEAGSANVDLIRGCAAWAVMCSHLRAMFFVDLQNVERSSALVKAIYFFSGFGHQAVVVFFVLSGFLVSSSIIARHIRGTWSWRNYTIDRFSRLYVVLIPGLLFGLLWDKIGGSVFARTGVYLHPLAGFGDIIVNERLGFKTFLANAFFLQTIVAPTFGSNTPLWSLANEFWYYVLFPIILCALLAWVNGLLRRALLFTILAVVVVAFVKLAILEGFLIWLAGVALVIAYSRCNLSKKWWLALYVLSSSLLLAACLLFARAHRTGVVVSDFALGITFSLFLFGILAIPAGVPYKLYSSTAHFVAGFSYSLYVLHFPLLLLFRAWIVPPQKWQPDGTHLLYGTVVGTLAVTFAWLISMVTEKKTDIARGWIRQKFSQERAMMLPPKMDPSGRRAVANQPQLEG